jgi:hypothetical protein
MLRGLGTAMALPVLDAMMPSIGFGATNGAAAAAGPKRVAWLYVPNGIDMQNWTPATTGAAYELTPTLAPLAPFKDKMTIISGMMCDKANANGDGPGDHSRAMPSYLTGVQARKTQGANIHIGTSADQAAAARVGHLTRFPSLELGIEEGTTVGSCDSGYSCVYIHNMSWKNDTTPMLKDCDPRSIFDRLFSNGNQNESAEASAKRSLHRKSMLDFILADAHSLEGSLGAADKRKVDEYMTSVREIERRIDRMNTEEPITPPDGAIRPNDFVFTNGVRSSGLANTIRNYPEHVALVLDMMVLAFQTDLTRIITCPFANESSNQSYPFADAPVPHHSTSHHQQDPVKMAQLAKINLFHIKQVAYLLEKLDKIQEGNGSLLDNCLIAYGSGNGDGNRHNHDDLPLLLLGKGGGTVATGRHLRVDNVPLNNLWLSMIERVGAPLDQLGDSTCKLSLV